MAVGKTNPQRQQMINMMYLVLTALLALNVSAEILNAFRVVNEKMDGTIELLDQKNEFTTEQLNKLHAKTPDAVELFYSKNNAAIEIADKLYKKVEVLKQKIIDESGGVNEETGHMEGEKDLEVCQRLMVDQGLGDELEAAVMEARQDFIDLLKDVPSVNMEDFMSSILINIENPGNGPAKTNKKAWAYETFHMMPAIAGVTHLTGIQQDIRTTQANIADKLLSSIGADDFTFDSLIPVVNTTKSAVSINEELTAEILLAAYDSKQQPEIFIGENKVEVKDGKAIYKPNTSSQGSYNIPVKIVVKNKKKGTTEEYESSLNYDVFQTAAIISADKMNVFYAGLENPVSVSVPGYKPEDVKVSIRGGSLKGASGAGNYIVTVPGDGSVRKSVISVSVATADGGVRSIGSKDFRVMRVPSPTPKFGSKESGPISRGEIRIVNNISVVLENFVFEGLAYRCTRFQLVYLPKGSNKVQTLKANNGSLTSQMKSVLSQASRGDMIIIEDIYATSKGLGNRRLPSSITLTVK
jgi:gliding motility-associated protein GldM